jgi:hypothetical protein
MENILEAVRLLVTVCLSAAVVWQVREIKILHRDKFDLHKLIVELKNKNLMLEDKIKSTEKERDENAYKVIAMQKAVSDFKKSIKVK